MSIVVLFDRLLSSFSLSGITSINAGQHRVKAFKLLWRCFSPRRVHAICWKILHQRVPTKVSLIEKRIIAMNGEATCVLCESCDEDLLHLLFSCPFSSQIWDTMFSWLKCNAILPDVPSRHLTRFCSLISDGKMKRVAAMLWTGIVWSIWKCRNEMIFDNTTPNIHKVVCQAISTSRYCCCLRLYFSLG